MSPILVRPVREQFEHDRIIRLLHGKRRPRHEAGMNPGAERNVPVGTGLTAVYPDLVLHSTEHGRRLAAVVEVETGESVNHLEALAEWAHYARLRTAFHLYVPATMVDVARRLCEDNHISVTEVWSYHCVSDDVRFTLIHRSKDAVSLDAVPSRSAASRSSSTKRPAAGASKVPKAAASRGPAKHKSAARAKAPAKRASAKRTTGKRAPASRSAKAPAARRKQAPAKKAARPQKRK